jgi:methylated-DNA-[protein]-cysteine S-methyltransferase
MRRIVEAPTDPSSILIESPVGGLVISASERGIRELAFQSSEYPGRDVTSSKRHAVIATLLAGARQQLREYFEGTRTEFELPLDLIGTDFQKRVWRRLCQIPFGTTMSYGQLAAALGDPKSARAVGLANGKNPVAIIVPCHRVIGADGSLTGFGGGLDVKRKLLDHERSVTGHDGLGQGSLFAD